MKRHRVVAVTPGVNYTIALVRFLSDTQAVDLTQRLVGHAQGTVPVKISELIAYKEVIGPNGLALSKREVGRVKL